MRHLPSDFDSFLKSFAARTASMSQSGHAGLVDDASATLSEDLADIVWQRWTALRDDNQIEQPLEVAQSLSESENATPDVLLLGDEFSFTSTVLQFADQDAPVEQFDVEAQQYIVAASIEYGASEYTDSDDAQTSETFDIPQQDFSGSAIDDGRSPDRVPGTPTATPPSPTKPTDNVSNGRPLDQVPGPATSTPPSPPKPTDNESNGRPADAVPDDTGPTVLTSYTSGGPSAASDNLEVQLIGTWTAELQASFISAADYLSQMILSDLPDAFANGQLIDDMVITAELDNIDGVGGILGSAGPTQIRNDGTYLPITGQMTFDSADAQNQLNNGNWEAIILHEMMHTLGLGTLWSLMGLTSGSVAGGDIRFTGQNATTVYQTEFPVIAGADSGSLNGVPVETDGGPGTAGGHWDEVLFDAELMTGYIDPGAYVSEMTIASFEDMGYDTIFDDPNDPTDLFAPYPADPLLDLA